MNKSVLISCLGLAAAFFMPLFWGEPTAAPAKPAEALFESEPPAPESPPPSSPPPEQIRVKTDAGTVEIDMQEYLVGVVAAEMPASFEPEALKAQAVAARTYAMYCVNSQRHSGGQVCTDFSCCQSWSGDEALRELWGDGYDLYKSKIASSVSATAGQYLAYEGEPVFAAFHSSSASFTEDCAKVWNAAPYLISVSSPETAADVPDYVSYVRCSPLDFRDTVLYAFPAADFTSEEGQWIGPCTLDGSGRVESLVLGGETISGATLRSLFKLRSTAFELSYENSEFVFKVTGYGHGVGMSQYGANVMAKKGADYTKILAHYYTGTALIS